VKWWKGAQKQVHQAIYCVTLRGWQSPFATETEGLSPTGNSIASAEQTSAARPWNKPGYILRHPGQAGVLSKARSGLVGWFDPGSSLMGMSMERYRGAMNTRQNDLSVNPCNPFHPYDAWHANLIRIDWL